MEEVEGGGKREDEWAKWRGRGSGELLKGMAEEYMEIGKRRRIGAWCRGAYSSEVRLRDMNLSSRLGKGGIQPWRLQRRELEDARSLLVF